MRKKALFAVVWLVLFGATLGISAIASRAEQSKTPSEKTTADVMRDIAEDLLLLELDNVRRRSTLESAVSSPDFDKALSEHILTHADSLRRCKASVMKNSKRLKEFIEVSFVPEELISQTGSDTRHRTGALHRLRLRAVVFERATASLSLDEQECVLRAFGSFEFEAAQYPATRHPFRFCIGKGSSLPSS